MKFYAILVILQKRYNLSFKDTFDKTIELESDLKAFKTENDLIKFLESLEKEAIERKLNGGISFKR